MQHWMEGDWPDEQVDANEADESFKRFKVACEDLMQYLKDEQKESLREVMEDIEAYYDYSDDPRTNGWVGDDGLP